MPNAHEPPPNLHTARSSVSNWSQNCLTPSPVASPLTLFDAHEMADLIKRTLIQTDAVIAADIAKHMETTGISGQDFLNHNPIGLRTLSKNNDQAFQQLKNLQQGSLDADTSFSTLFFHRRRFPLISSGFPELAHLIRRRRLPTDLGSLSDGANGDIGNVMDHLSIVSGPSTIRGPQISEEECFNFDAFDYGDDEDDTLPPNVNSIVTIVNETSPAQVAGPHLSLRSEASDAPVNPTPEGEPPLVPSTPSNCNGPQNDSAISTITILPDTDTDTTPAIHGAIHIHGHNAELQPIRGTAPTMTAHADTVPIHGLDNLESVNTLNSEPTDEVQKSITLLQNDSTLLGPEMLADAHSPSDTLIGSSSLTSSCVDEDDPGAAIEMPLGGPQLEDLPALSLDHPQTLIDNQALIVMHEKGLEPPHLPANEPVATRPQSANADINSATASTDESPRSDRSPSCSSNLTTKEVHHDLDPGALPQSDLQCLQDTDDLIDGSNVDVNLPATSTHASTLTLFVDTLPLIPVTPSSSPVFEGLSQYMTLQGSDTPGVVSQEDSRADLDNVTPVQREISATEHTLWPLPEAPRIGLLSSTTEDGRSLRSDCSQPVSKLLESSDESKLTPGSNVNIVIQPDPPYRHPLSQIHIPDPYLGMSNGCPSPLERMQVGLLNVIPTFFALDREMINRAVLCSATSQRP